MSTKVGKPTAKGTTLVLKAAAFAASKHRDPERQDTKAGVSSVAQAIVISLLCLLVRPAHSMMAAQPSRLMLIRVQDGGERGLLNDLKRIATEAGMTCRAKPTTTYDGKPDTNPGFDCYLTPSDGPFRGNLSAVGLLAKKVVFLFILSNNVATPNGDVDPEIARVLVDFTQGFAGNHAVQSFEECWAPDFDRCMMD
jgi:hypothetical protein